LLFFAFFLAFGFSILASPTFGYLVGFVFASFLVGRLVEGRQTHSTLKWILVSLSGLGPIYIFGVAYLYMIYNLVIAPSNPINMATALKFGIYPFILVDVIKAVLAGLTGRVIYRALKKSAVL